MNGYLLDTHAWLWAISSPKKCSVRVRRILEDPSAKIHLSVASAWEMAIKISIGKLELNVGSSIDAFVTKVNADTGVRIIGVSLQDIAAVQTLPWHHRDPFDRLLVATASTHDFEIISSDKNLRGYGVKVVW